MSKRILEVTNLTVKFGDTTVVDDVSFHLEAGEIAALVGESGSGKSVSALSVLQLLPYPHASHPAGSIELDGEQMIGASKAQLQAIRGGEVFEARGNARLLGPCQEGEPQEDPDQKFRQ